MLTRRQFLALLGGGAVIAGGAAVGISRLPGGTTAGATPEIKYGQERCAYCTMSIDDPRFAAAWRITTGTERHFDDIGCMVNAYRREGPPEGTRFWVHDYNNQSWMDSGAAAYVISPSIKTPMAYGVAAFASTADATATIPTAKTTLAWADVLSTVERKG